MRAVVVANCGGLRSPSAQPRRIPGVYHTTRKQESRVLRSSLSVYLPKSADFISVVGVCEADLAVCETPKGTRAWRRAWKLYSCPFCNLYCSYTSDSCSRVVQGAVCARRRGWTRVTWRYHGVARRATGDAACFSYARTRNRKMACDTFPLRSPTVARVSRTSEVSLERWHAQFEQPVEMWQNLRGTSFC